MSLGKQKQKSKKVIVAVAAVVIAIAGGSGYFYVRGQTKAAAAANDASSIKTATLSKTDLMDYISVSGTIYSGNSQNVYTTQSYPIKEVYVEVGDVVKAGDVLAVLDMTDLDYDISQAEHSLSNSVKSESESRQSAANNITNAQTSVETSKLSLEKAQTNYDLLKEKLEKGTNNELVNAVNSMDTTRQTMENTEKDAKTKTNDYETNKQLFEVGGISQYALETSERSMDDAVTAYETALSNYNKAVDTYNRTKSNLEEDLVTAERDLETSKINYQNSLNSLAQAQAKSSNVTSSVETQEISLVKLQEKRLEAEIIAPIDGTVTTVNATVGMTGAGQSGSGSSGSTLFVIEDMNNLYVSSSIKEFRIGEVSIGQEAYVTTDATADKTFKGHLSFIAPTATETSSTSNVEFEIKIQLEETDSNLRIGMNAYANIILESKQDIYAVDYDAVSTSRSGESFIYASENGKVVEIPVTTGMETDTLIEISGDQLKDGMIIFQNASLVMPGQAFEAQSDTGFMMPNNGEPPSGMTMPQDGTNRQRPDESQSGTYRQQGASQDGQVRMQRSEASGNMSGSSTRGGE